MTTAYGEAGNHEATDIEALERALIDWINTCCPEADVEEFDDLADGAILADVLQLYAPDVDPTNSSAGSAKRLHSCIGSYFGNRIELPRLAGNMHNGVFCKPKLLRSLTEAVLLAAVEGPKKEEAVQAIMNLEETKQMALGNALQRLMADQQEADGGGEETAEMGESNPPTPRVGQVSAYRSSADLLQDEIQDMKHRCNAEMSAVDSLENSEKALQAQLRAIMVDFAAEEEQAAETALLIQKWQRNYGDEMRQRKAECNLLQQELQKEAEQAKDLPQQQSKLQLQLDQELHACRELQDNTEYLDVELREAAQSNAKDDLSTVKAEMMASQMQQNMVDRKLRRAEDEEREQIHIAKGLWENLHLTEVAASRHNDTLRQVRRVAEKEEETEADVLGLLEFRECEMRQLELSLGESGTAGAHAMGDGRASISGPGAELMHSAPDMAELRSLLRELGQIARKNSSAQSELNQQQQRTRDLAHRLQQLEAECAQHQNSEVAAMAEFHARREEELRYGSELRERSQSVQPAAKPGESDLNVTDQEAAEMQSRLAALRSQAGSMLKEESAAAAKLAQMQEEETRAVEKLSTLLQEENQAATKLSETQEAISKAEEASSQLRLEIRERHTRLEEISAKSATLPDTQVVQPEAISKVEGASQQEQTKTADVKQSPQAEQQTRLVLLRSEASSQRQEENHAAETLAETVQAIATLEAVTHSAAEQTRLSLLSSEATSQRQEEHQAAEMLSETVQAISTLEAAMGIAQPQSLSVSRSEAASQRQEENQEAQLSQSLQAAAKAKAASREPMKQQQQPEAKAGFKAEAQTATSKEIKEDVNGADAHGKGNKALLRKLRQQLAEEERKLRQWEVNQVERRQAMQLETQLISDSIREVGTRCQMLVDKHRALLDDRKRLEAEA